MLLKQLRNDTSAVGNRGTANCIRPWIWICMVVRDLWKMVKGCKHLKEKKKKSASKETANDVQRTLV